MKNYLPALAALLLLTTQYSCKKEDSGVTYCRVTSWGTDYETFDYTYDNAGFVKRATLSTGNYLDYTQTGNVLVRQAYTSSGVPTGNSISYTVNSQGYFTAMPSGSDTIYLSYNQAGQMTEFTRRNDTILSRVVITYQDGDALSAIEYRNDSTVKSTSTFEFYTNRENHSNLNILYDILDNRMGKPCKHFIKRQTQSNSSGNLSYTNFYYTFDDNGNPTALQVVSQPSNNVTNINFTYSCN